MARKALPQPEPKQGIREQVPLCGSDRVALGRTNSALCVAFPKAVRVESTDQLAILEDLISKSPEAKSGDVVSVTRSATCLLVVFYSSTAVRDEALDHMKGELISWQGDMHHLVLSPFPATNPYIWFVPLSPLTPAKELAAAIESWLSIHRNSHPGTVHEPGSRKYDIRRLMTTGSLPTSTFAVV